jgi:predicted acetyltransferase
MATREPAKPELKESRTGSCPPDNVSPGWRIDLMDGGKSVSRLWIVDRILRVGGAEIRTGGISSVGTDEAYRGRGLAGRAMEAALRLMKREGYPLTVLHGIPGFYPRFGYVPCMPDYELRIKTSHADPGGSRNTKADVRLRAAGKGDIPAIARLHNREQRHRPGSAVRDPRTWKGFPRSVGWFTKPGVRVAVDVRDAILGYAVFDADPALGRVAEVGGTDAAVLDALLAFLARRAKAAGKEDIHFNLPPDHPLAMRARRIGCESLIRYPHDGEFMGRIVDRKGFMECLSASGKMTARDRALCGRMAPEELLQSALGYRGHFPLSPPSPPSSQPSLAHMSWADRF